MTTFPGPTLVSPPDSTSVPVYAPLGPGNGNVSGNGPVNGPFFTGVSGKTVPFRNVFGKTGKRLPVTGVYGG